MINIPKSLCEDCKIPVVSFSPQTIDSIELCEPCPEVESFSRQAITGDLCPCPVEEPVQLRLPTKVPITTDVDCFVGLLKRMSNNKFCESGPKCKT